MKKASAEASQARYAVKWRGHQIAWFLSEDDAKLFIEATRYPVNYEVVELVR